MQAQLTAAPPLQTNEVTDGGKTDRDLGAEIAEILQGVHRLADRALEAIQKGDYRTVRINLERLAELR